MSRPPKRADTSGKPVGKVWQREQAFEFLAELQPKVEAVGFGLGLTGSLLFKSEATDLDIIIYPLNGSNFNRDLLQPVLDTFCRQKLSPGRLKVAWERHCDSTDSKHVEKRVFRDGRLLDVFHLT